MNKTSMLVEAMREPNLATYQQLENVLLSHVIHEDCDMHPQTTCALVNACSRAMFESGPCHVLAQMEAERVMMASFTDAFLSTFEGSGYETDHASAQESWVCYDSLYLSMPGKLAERIGLALGYRVARDTIGAYRYLAKELAEA